jgi:hypothetical protein
MKTPKDRTALLLLAVGTLIALLAVTFLSTTDTTDAQRDWLSAKAAVDGTTPYVSIAELADRYQPNWDHEWALDAPHPRTPGAILLSVPMVAVDFYKAANLVRILSVFALTVIVWVAYRVTGNRWVIAGLPLLAVSLPMFSAYHPANTGLIVAALVAGAYIAPPRVRGVLLGVATVLRLWPALIFLGYRDRNTWKSGVLTVAAVEGLGWLLIRPALSEVIDAVFFGEGADAVASSGNASLWTLPLWFAIPAILAVIVVAVRSRRFLPIACAALLVTPLSWPAYHAFLYPWLARRPWLLVGWFIYPLMWDHLGLVALVVAISLLVSANPFNRQPGSSVSLQRDTADEYRDNRPQSVA